VQKLTDCHCVVRPAVPINPIRKILPVMKIVATPSIDPASQLSTPQSWAVPAVSALIIPNSSEVNEIL
jgi:hypothetical protein